MSFSWWSTWFRALVPWQLCVMWLVIFVGFLVGSGVALPTGYSDTRVIYFAGAVFGAGATFALPPRGPMWPHCDWQHGMWVLFLYFVCAVPGELLFLVVEPSELGQFTTTWAWTMIIALVFKPVLAALPVVALVFGAGFFRGSIEDTGPHWYSFSWLIGGYSNVSLVAVAAISVAVLVVVAAFRR